MAAAQTCRATLKAGSPCRYKAKPGSAFCGVHQHLAENAEPSKESKSKSRADRDAKLALIVSTGLALVEIVEKAITHYPALLKLLELFRENTGNRWRYQEVVSELGAVAAYKTKGDVDSLRRLAGSDPFGRAEIATEKDAENVAQVTAIHNIAITHWATSTALAYASDHDDRFASYGGIWTDKPIRLSAAEKGELLRMYEVCRRIPFVDDLRTRNFLSMWG